VTSVDCHRPARGGCRPRPALVLALVWLVATLLNVTKAVHMDDSTYLVIARNILEAPLQPLSTTLSLSGEILPVSSINQPPLLPYGFSAVLAIFGESEVALHVFLSVFTALAIFLFHDLGRRLCPRSALALTVAFALGPAFLPGQNLMTDVPQVAAWLAFSWLLIRPPEGRAPRYAAAAAVAGAACLVKYTSVVLVPLLLVPVVARREWRRAGVVLIPIGVLAAWSIWNLLDYGGIHLLERAAHVGEHSGLAERGEAWLACLGGVAPFSIAVVPFLARRARWVILLAGAAAIAALLRWGWLGGGAAPAAVLEAVFLANGLLLVLAAAIALGRLPGERREDVALLAGWLVAGALFPVLLAPFMAVRHVLPVIPALLLVLGRRLEEPASARWLAAGVAPSVVLGVALAVADWQYADTFRTQARAVRERFGPGTRLWYLGDWGWRWYAEAEGMRHYLNDHSQLLGGDVVVIPQATAGPNGVARRDQPRVRLIDVVEPLPPSVLLPRIMLPFPEGGYYSLGSEGLPWTFSRTPLERIMIFRVRATSTGSGGIQP
jgi:hypothetical protein